MSHGRPPFKSGDRRLSPQWLNDVDRARRALETGGTSGAPTGDTRITVLLVHKPIEEDTTLRVRRVRYNTPRPQECDGTVCHYEFSTDEFDAYPDFGQTVMDYEDDDWAGPAITDDDTFMKAYKEDGSWRVEKPASATAEIRFVVVLGGRTEGGTAFGTQPPAGDEAGPLTTFELWVQEVKLGETNWEAKGEPMRAATLPRIPGDLYRDWTLEGGNTLPATNATVILRMEKAAGLWIVDQRPVHEVGPRPTGATGQCDVTP